MAHRQVNLTKRVRTADGWRYCPVVLSANGRVKPDLVIVNDKPEHHPEGAYYLDWYEGSKRIRISVGKDANDANHRRLRKEAEFQARISGVTVVPEEPVNSQQTTLAKAIEEYLNDIKLTRRPATHAAYSLSLGDFARSCKKTYLGEIERRDLLDYLRFLQEVKRLSDRTQYNRLEDVIAFLKSYGVENLLKKHDRPKFVEPEPESYSDDELENFLAACDDEEKDYFSFLLMTGCRKREATYCAWNDVDLKAGTVRVTAKPEYGFRPKDCEERTIPIPDALIAILRKRAKNHGTGLVFQTKNGTARKHRTHMLEWSKRIAKRAGLNPERFWLHKFRATFATKHLQAGVDLRTVQSWLGHSDLESTMRYLTPARDKTAREKVNGTFSAIAGGHK